MSERAQSEISWYDASGGEPSWVAVYYSKPGIAPNISIDGFHGKLLWIYQPQLVNPTD